MNGLTLLWEIKKKNLEIFFYAKQTSGETELINVDLRSHPQAFIARMVSILFLCHISSNGDSNSNSSSIRVLFMTHVKINLNKFN